MARSKRSNRPVPEPPRATVEPHADSRRDRTLPALAGALAAYLGLVLIASMHPSPATWGYDLFGYLPPHLRTPLALLAALGLGSVLSALWLPRWIGPRIRLGPRIRPGARLLGWLPWMLLIPYAWLLWSLRTRTHLLGDQIFWLSSFREHQLHLHSEPLAAAMWYLFAAALRLLRIPASDPILAVVPVLCGVAFAAVAWKLAGLLAPLGGTRALPLGLLLTLGTVQLYCGYIESYPLASVPMFAFLWLVLRDLKGGTSGIPAAIALALAIGSHIVAIYLLPAYLYWVFRRSPSFLSRVSLAALPVALVLVLFYFLDYPMGDLLNPFKILRVALMSSRADSPDPGSGTANLLQQGLDLWSVLLLVTPVPLAVLLSRLASWKTAPPGEERGFLLIAAAAGLLVTATLVVPGSPAQDWDLMSLTVLPLAVLGISMAGAPGLASPRTRWGLTAIALASASAFVLVNADAERAVRRFKSLVGPGARLSAHERAYGNEKVMEFYEARGAPDSALVYARRALSAEPINPRYWTNAGFTLYRLGRDDEAIPHLEEAIRLDATRWTAHYDLGLCLIRKERYTEAAHALRGAVLNGGSRPDVYHALGIALFRSGEADSAVATWTEVLVRWPDYANHLRTRQGEAALAPPPGVPSTP